MNMANGNSDPEWGTVILAICGIKEVWSEVESGKWVSDKAEIRGRIELAVAEIKRRTVENVKAHKEMEEATMWIQEWLDKQRK